MAKHNSDQIQNKLQLLFTKILEPNYEMNNYYVDGLITKLSDLDDADNAFMDNLPFIASLLKNAIKHINAASPPVHVTVHVFVYRFLAIVAQRENYFVKLFRCDHEIISSELLGMNSANLNPSLRVAYMEVALAVLKHNGGRIWIFDNGLWKEILDLSNEKQTIFVIRQKYKFFKTLLWFMNDMHDETNIKLVINCILKPVYDAEFTSSTSLSAEQEEKISQQVLPIMHMFLALVTEERRIESPTMLMNILIKDFSLCSHLCLIFDRIRSSEVALLAPKLLYYFSLANIFLTKPLSEQHEYTADDFLDVTVSYYNTIQRFVQRRQPISVLDFCNSTVTVWSSVWRNRSPICPRNLEINPELQFIFISLVPSLVYVKLCDGPACVSDQRVKEFIMQFLNMNCEHITRAAYLLRDLMLEFDPVNITLQSVKRLYCLKNYLSNKQANVVFQTLYYVLTMFEPLDENGEVKVEENFEASQDKNLVMTHVLDIVLSLVRNHNISWTESLEIIGLYNVVYKLLKRPNLSCKFIVTALNVIEVIVRKFLTPNLSLLLESKPGSDIHELGKLIYLRLHDIHWEVRDSALELLLVCTKMAYIKFPPFQSQISDNRLVNVAAAIAFNDEYYVQASALKCLGAATKINKLWEQLRQEYPNILEKLVDLLRDNQEGIVRKEACNVLLEVYQNVKINNEFKLVLYEHMVSAAIFDCHWEVQLCALQFWKNVILGLFSDQGMLDGTFPPVTFSKETRKIVNLNATEIQRRILKILEELSSIGCLTVLVTLLNEETEVDILDLALTISNDFYNILIQYKLQDVIQPNENDIQNVNELLILKTEEENNPNSLNMDIEYEPKGNSEKVIDGIVNVDDLNLLANIYENQMNLQPQSQTQPKKKLFKCASPYLYVSHLNSKDFQVIVEQKKQWKRGIRSVSSLLDDVLGVYEMNVDANALDCY